MPVFDDFESLIMELEDDMRHVIDAISEAIYFIVIGNIQKIVYDPWGPMSGTGGMVREYQRQGWDGGFIGSWIHTPASHDEKGNIFSTIASYDAIKDELGLLMSHSEMTLEPTIHSSEELSPSRDVFLDMLDRINQSATDRRPFMDKAIAEGTDWDFLVPVDLGPFGPKDNWWTRPRDYWNPSLRNIIDQDIVNSVALAFFKANDIKIVK